MAIPHGDSRPEPVGTKLMSIIYKREVQTKGSSDKNPVDGIESPGIAKF